MFYDQKNEKDDINLEVQALIDDKGEYIRFEINQNIKRNINCEKGRILTDLVIYNNRLYYGFNEFTPGFDRCNLPLMEDYFTKNCVYIDGKGQKLENVLVPNNEIIKKFLEKSKYFEEYEKEVTR